MLKKSTIVQRTAFNVDHHLEHHCICGIGPNIPHFCTGDPARQAKASVYWREIMKGMQNTPKKTRFHPKG